MEQAFSLHKMHELVQKGIDATVHLNVHVSMSSELFH